MSRNAESRFSVNPTDVRVQRSRFEVPFNHSTACNVGDLVPFYCREVLPGDSLQVKHSKVVRTSTLLKPVIDNLITDVYWFFVPMRLCWTSTKEFFGENSSGPWYPATEKTHPQIKYAPDGNYLGTVFDYLGLPIEARSLAAADDDPGYDFTVSALPVRGYNVIYNDWFIDQMTMTPPNIYKGDSNVTFDPDDPVKGGKVYVASKLHDQFTSGTPQPQRGPAVSFDLLDSAAVTIPSAVLDVKAATSSHSTSNPVKFGGSFGDSTFSRLTVGSTSDVENGSAYIGQTAGVIAGEQEWASVTRTNLTVNYPGSSSIPITGVNSLSVNELRLAFQLQRYYERSALFGGRYTEFIRAQFGTISPDARLQRSEYLGGNRITLNVQQVEQTSETNTTPLGHLGAYSLTSDVHGDFMHSFTEHGFVYGLIVTRYKHRYAQSLERMWSRKTMFDHYMPVFASLGNQAVLRKEIYCTGDPENDDQVFAYQEAWYDYRYMPDRVSNVLRPGVSGSLASWHYADYYSEAPTLSADWMVEDKTNVDRTLAVTSAVSPQLLMDIHVDQIWTRAMPLYSIPGLIDHH